MAYTIRHFGTSGRTFYAKPCSIVASPWDGDDIALTENGTTGEYTASIVSPANAYVIYEQIGGTPAPTDPMISVVDFTAELNADAIQAKTDLIGANAADSPNAVTAQGNASTAALSATSAASTATAINTKIGTPAGASVSADIAALAGAAGTAVWAAATSGLTAIGSIGRRLMDFFSAYTDGRAAKLDLISAMAGSVSPSSPALNTDISVTANNHYAATFMISGMDSTGWTEMVFAVKADADADDDADALLLVKVTNPAAGGDGLQTINRHPAATASDATLAVSGVSPDTALLLTIKAAGLAIPPSPSSKAYLWELVKWTGITKEKIGGAKFKVLRPVVRATAAI